MVVTTIAAQVNPPVFKLPERTLMRSTISVNDDVFVPRILNEEDFQDGRVTLPIISNSSKGNTKINVIIDTHMFILLLNIFIRGKE